MLLFWKDHPGGVLRMEAQNEADLNMLGQIDVAAPFPRARIMTPENDVSFVRAPDSGLVSLIGTNRVLTALEVDLPARQADRAVLGAVQTLRQSLAQVFDIFPVKA